MIFPINVSVLLEFSSKLSEYQIQKLIPNVNVFQPVVLLVDRAEQYDDIYKHNLSQFAFLDIRTMMFHYKTSIIITIKFNYPVLTS